MSTAISDTLSQPNIQDHDVLVDIALGLTKKVKISKRSRISFIIPRYLKEIEQEIQKAHRYFETAAQIPLAEMSPAAEWLLDNNHIVKQAFRQIRIGMPNDYYARLPQVCLQKDQELARIFVLAKVFTSHSEYHLNSENILSFIQTYQATTPLNTSEIWAFPIMLRFCVLEMLAISLANLRHSPIQSGFLFSTAINTEKSNCLPPSDVTVVSNSILSLRLLDTQDWQVFFEDSSLVERELRNDPAGTYPKMNFNTRNHYRNVIEELSQISDLGEIEIAEAAIDLSKKGDRSRTRHVGYYLIGHGRDRLEKVCKVHIPSEKLLQKWCLRHTLALYLGGASIGLLLISGLLAEYAAINGGSVWQIILVFLLSLLPASEFVFHLINCLVTNIVPPKSLPMLDFQKGIPTEFSTMVVIPSLLKNEKEMTSLINQIENHFIGNSDPNIHFALLTDLSDASQKEISSENKLIERTKSEITRLNNQYGNETYKPFLFFHRELVWNPGENSWMGWERKRGKLEEFNRLLLTQKSGNFCVQYGDLSILSKTRYVITTDADTLLPRESAHRLIGAIAHPLNQPEFDPVSNKIIAGYTVLQPRLQVQPSIANLSTFTRIFSGDNTLDLYSRAVSDVYQDLFDEGNFIGKGIYDVHAFDRSLRDRVPENSILSHDLFEGLHGRCGLITEITLFEDYPPQYLAYMHRLHRWVRGDWQLLPWLMPKVPTQKSGLIPNNLSLLSKWKIFDNLRRSLISSSILFLLVSGWFFLPGSPLVWMTTSFSIFILEFLTTLFSNLKNRKPNDPPDIAAQPLQNTLFHQIIDITFLPYKVLVEQDAIITTLARLAITHKKLLQWITAAHTVNIFGKELKIKVVWREMLVAPLVSIVVFIGLINYNFFALPLASPLLIGWLISPYIAVYISRIKNNTPIRLKSDEKHKLRMLARSTWLFFEHFVGPEDHWLPPDHFQEDPRGLVAHRTSPTNIGLLLVSTLAAYDLGYIGLQDLVQRIRNTLDTLELLEKVRGHFFNWYDTHSLCPLPPRYISTVDSGNLAASLIVVCQGLKEIMSKPLVQWRGLVDTLDMLLSTLEEVHVTRKTQELHTAILDLRDNTIELDKAASTNYVGMVNVFREKQSKIEILLLKLIETSTIEMDQEIINRLSTWVDRTRSQLNSIEYDLQTLIPWHSNFLEADILQQTQNNPDFVSNWSELESLFTSHPVLANTPTLCSRCLEILDRLRSQLTSSDFSFLDSCNAFAHQLGLVQNNTQTISHEINTIENIIEKIFHEMNFEPLFDRQRQVFHIGFNVEINRLDPNYYDLLASEARIASLIAISKGEVPQSHWSHLSRPLTMIKNMRTLLSWSGTMFEYLMPTLFLKSYPNTLLEQSCQIAVEYQISYAGAKKIPWGISESSYYFFDSSQIYQYRAFGAPALGYKRDLDEDMVITPYASILALPFATQATMRNIEVLKKLNMCGLFGLYEALDFTSSRLSVGQEYAQIRSYMAHHQGMILMALDNYLLGNILVNRFHADPRIKNIELLLQEKTPLHVEAEQPDQWSNSFALPTNTMVALDPWSTNPSAPYPQIHSLSNGNYSLLISASGSGYSRWGNIDLTRWRSDGTLDNWGTWLYIRDDENGQLWSATSQPTAIQPESQKVTYYPHKVEFERRDGDISINFNLTIAADEDVEVRRLTLTNHGDTPRILSMTSYAEVILTLQENDRRHPAFNRLFIESEYIKSGQILLFHRRPRSSNEKAIYLAHFVTFNNENSRITGYETDRASFLGQGNTPLSPISLLKTHNLSGSTGATLDPIFALQAQINLQPYESIQLAYVTLAASSRKEALQLALQYKQWRKLENAFVKSAFEAENEMAQYKLTSRQIELFQKLLSAVLYPASALRADPVSLSANILGQSGLWPFSISGDCPILLARITTESGFQLLTELFRAHTYWRRHGLMIDLVILNRQETSYQDDYTGKFQHLLSQTNSEPWINKRGGIFILREDQINPAENILLITAARVVLDDANGSFEEQLRKMDRRPVRLPHFIAVREPISGSFTAPEIERPGNLLFDNGLGGFSSNGYEYVIYLKASQWTPAPWINVIANPDFGFIVSNNGLGCTWSQNSGENRLTPWHNDPVCDTPSEAIYLRDEDTGQVWSPTPLPSRDDSPYLIRHGAGYSIFEHASHGLIQTLRVFAVVDKPVKIIQLKLENKTPLTRRINITYYAEWVLGNSRDTTAQYIIPEFDSRHFVLLARNPYNEEFSKNVAFLASTRELNWVTTDRCEFLGIQGNYTHPAALERVGLAASVQAGTDPCAALQTLLWLAPGESKEVTYLLGEGSDREEAEKLIAHYQEVTNIQSAWEAVGPFWDKILNVIKVETPEPAMNILLNRWLLYEAISCRLWGRTALYQSSGAFGFRDQLQDVLAALHCRPELARTQILNAAQRQFESGDVLHWWHPPSGRGIRTRISDNLLWLPYCVAQYVQSTGDTGILKEIIPFLSGEPLNRDEDERYGHYFSSGEVGTLYDHCLRAISKGVTAGSHGLPLMGSGDWNDGMNHVGIKGKGESIWLGWFAYTILTDFANLCKTIDEHSQAELILKQAETLRCALELSGWDGKWYRRAYFDDGTALGSSDRHECTIDSISQSWAVLSGASNMERSTLAMNSLIEHLVNQSAGLIQLLDPPFNLTLRDPGYIKGYPQGIRENGGQYTHAAAWVIWAFAALGDGDRATSLFQMINPILHANTPDKVSIYKVEPYVIAADVYSMPPHVGRGGWTWYTGSASWMVRLGFEAILGIKREGQLLKISPCIPKHWPGFSIKYRFGDSLYNIQVYNHQKVNSGVIEISLDGFILSNPNILLVDDKKDHFVVVKMGKI